MRKHYIDYLRAIGIIAVITIHVTMHFYSMKGEIGHIGWWLSNLLNSAAKFAVPLFVMISGAVLLGKEINMNEFYRKRAVRLIPAIIFWNFFYLGFRVYSEHMDIGMFIYASKMLVVNGAAYYHLWYLSMFACLMMFVPFINIFVNGDTPTSTHLLSFLVIVFIFIILKEIAFITLEVKNITIGWFTLFPWYVAYFIGGYYLDRHGDELRIANLVILVLITVIILVGVILNYYVAYSLKIMHDYVIFNQVSPFVFIITLSLFFVGKKNSIFFKENKVISAISDSSFGMYLIHPFFIYILSHQLPDYDSLPLMYIPIAIIVTTLASFCSIIFIRKTVFMRYVC